MGDEKGIKVSGGVKSLSQVEDFMLQELISFGSSNAITIYRNSPKNTLGEPILHEKK